MHILNSDAVTSLVAGYGYYVVFLVIALESAGVPMPGELTLVSAAIYAGTTGHLDIRVVVAVATAAAILGDNLGYWVGRRYGQGLIARHGARIGLNERRQLLGRYLFHKFGGAIVFFGRFTMLLRAYAALLAGANGLAPLTFFLWNAAGGVIWASLFGFGAYVLGAGIERVAGPAGWIALAGAAVCAIALWRFYKKHEASILKDLEDKSTKGVVV